MSQAHIRIVAVGIAITAVAIVSLATETTPQRSASTHYSAPAAWEVVHANDGRSEGNVDDKTY
ncbi:MAG TPA: hypothetical protein VM051_10100 [Usitatibacter sp.]|nr:hypothetical protein [Usitatibacter sp.]